MGVGGCVFRQLERINLSCTSAVKMSLLLLDYLFDRDTQAVSNVSGTGKLGKHQLDPLLMYGIQCKTVFFYSRRSVQFFDTVGSVTATSAASVVFVWRSLWDLR